MSYKTFQATPVAPETFQTFQSFMTFQPSRQFYNVPVFSRESTPFQHSPIRMHILQFYSSIGFQKTPPSTGWAITDITNITFKEREMLRYRSRCQDDIFPRIELIPSFVLSSDNTNCKNDIQLFHQLFDELSVHTDYH